jgi:hypothetical protein
VFLAELSKYSRRPSLGRQLAGEGAGGKENASGEFAGIDQAQR